MFPEIVFAQGAIFLAEFVSRGVRFCLLKLFSHGVRFCLLNFFSGGVRLLSMLTYAVSSRCGNFTLVRH